MDAKDQWVRVLFPSSRRVTIPDWPIGKESDSADPDFSGDPVPLIQVPGVSPNNVTSTKQNLDALTKFMVLATGNNSRNVVR